MRAAECDHTERINTYGSRGHGSTLLDDRHSVMGQFGQRVRVSRSWALMVVLLTWGAYGLCTSVVIQPGCPYHEVADPCRASTGSSGTVVSMTQCTRAEVGFFLSPPTQVGFGTKQGVTPACSVRGCSADQCLKTSQACAPAGANGDTEPASTECVAAESTVDIQPLQAVCYSLLLAVALSMWASGRPIDPSNARIAATLVMVFAVYAVPARRACRVACLMAMSFCCMLQVQLDAEHPAHVVMRLVRCRDVRVPEHPAAAGEARFLWSGYGLQPFRHEPTSLPCGGQWVFDERL